MYSTAITKRAVTLYLQPKRKEKKKISSVLGSCQSSCDPDPFHFLTKPGHLFHILLMPQGRDDCQANWSPNSCVHTTKPYVQHEE